METPQPLPLRSEGDQFPGLRAEVDVLESIVSVKGLAVDQYVQIPDQGLRQFRIRSSFVTRKPLPCLVGEVPRKVPGEGPLDAELRGQGGQVGDLPDRQCRRIPLARRLDGGLETLALRRASSGTISSTSS